MTVQELLTTLQQYDLTSAVTITPPDYDLVVTRPDGGKVAISVGK